jgi:hypothetical protein
VLVAVVALSLGLPGAAAADVTAVGGGATALAAALVLPTTERVDVVAARVQLPAGSGSATPVADTVEALDRPGAVRTGRLHTWTAGTPGPDGAVDSVAQTAAVLIGPADAPLVEVRAACSACRADSSGATGGTTVVDLRVGGRPVAVPTAPGSVVDLPGVGTLHVNEQTPLGAAPSAGIRVTALRFAFAAPGPFTGEVSIAESECRLAGAEVALPTTALGGVLLTGLAAAAFAVRQGRGTRGPRPA